MTALSSLSAHGLTRSRVLVLVVSLGLLLGLLLLSVGILLPTVSG